MKTALAALERLKEGNRRFVADVQNKHSLATQTRRDELVGGQSPFAIILGCSDSRVPAEIIFDQGLGDLFVIRVAGNVVAPSQIGSVEFAAERFGTKLVVLLGHSQCGAVLATIDEVKRPTEDRSPNLTSIVNRIRPAVEPLFKTNLKDQPDVLIEQAVKSNILYAAENLRKGSKILEQHLTSGDFLIVGAEYKLKTGVVEFFDGE